MPHDTPRHRPDPGPDFASLLARYRAGETVPQIAESLGVPRSHVYQSLRTAGVRFKGDPHPQPVRDGAVARYLGGESTVEIAASLDVPPSTVSRWLHSAGVPIVGPRGAKPKADVATRAQIVADYRSGLSSVHVGARHGLSPTTVRGIVRAEGGQVRDPGLAKGTVFLPEDVIDAVADAYVREGASFVTLAARHRISRAAVRTCLQMRGVPVRGRGRPRAA